MKSNKSSKSIGVGILFALTASLCCLTPVFVTLSGIGGIASSFSWMEPFRPYLLVLTVGILGFAWYQKLKSSSEENIACECDEDEKPSFWQSKLFLSLMTVISLAMLALPYYSNVFYSYDSPKPISKNAFEAIYKFEIKGMTCTGCEEHVKHEVLKLSGITNLEVSYKSGNAIISFDDTSTNEDSILVAIENTGYTVSSKLKIK